MLEGKDREEPQRYGHETETDQQTCKSHVLPGTAGSPQRKYRDFPDPAPWHILGQ